jgi:[NiFe] hydrogenase assembly HybE family chaperone
MQQGWPHNPQTSVQKVYSQVLETDMQHMAFCQLSLPVYATPFVHYQNQWLGVLLTPWMLSILILPGPNECWPPRQLADKLGLEFGAGRESKHYTFIVNQHPQLGQYLACSLMSPVKGIGDAESGIALAKDILNQLNQIPLHIEDHVDLSKRALFNRKMPLEQTQV